MADTKSDKKQKKELDKIKSSVFSRSLSLAKLTLQAGTKLAGQSLSSALSNESIENTKLKILSSQAQLISKELGELKGSLMKAGQMLSMYGEHFLPPEANQFLKTLQSDSPPLKWDAIYPIILSELGEEKVNELEIEKESIASASLGQVHRAKIRSTNEIIVLKVQYPNVDKAIESDLTALRRILSVLKLIPKDLNLDPLFSEIKTMLVQETNYLLEADMTEEFYNRLKDDHRYIVPKVYRSYSNRKILSTSFERGLKVDDPLVQSLPQQRRNQIASHFLDLYFKEIFTWHTVQTDPHNGNYKIRMNPHGQDQLILFDFGATRKYDKSFIVPYLNMVKAAYFNDSEALTRHALELNFIQNNDQPELKKVFTDFCLETVEPFLLPDDPRNKGQINSAGEYDWKNTDLPQRLSKKVFLVINQFTWRTPPEEILFLDRKTGGVFVFLSTLKAKMNSRDLLKPYIERDIS